MDNQMVSINNLSKHFKKGLTRKFILSNISFNVKRGETVCILGVSGCGKTTLLNAISGMDLNISGKIKISKKLNGEPIRLGYMLQDPGMLPWRTVFGNTELGMEFSNFTSEIRKCRAEEMLNFVELKKDTWNMYPHQLSGGMLQRVALARTLSVAPDLLLLDEALGQLDFKLRSKLSLGIRKIMKNIGGSILMITHSIEEASLVADRCIILGGTPATIVHEKSLEMISKQELRYGAIKLAANKTY